MFATASRIHAMAMDGQKSNNRSGKMKMHTRTVCTTRSVDQGGVLFTKGFLPLWATFTAASLSLTVKSVLLELVAALLALLSDSPAPPLSTSKVTTLPSRGGDMLPFSGVCGGTPLARGLARRCAFPSLPRLLRGRAAGLT